METVAVRPALRTRAEMREAVMFDGVDAAQKRSRFWMLLVLAAVIAAGGVIVESEATVIGAMMIAPLRIPILGTMLAVVLGDRVNLGRAVGLVVSGALATIGIGYAMGLLVVLDVNARNNTEVAAYSSAGVIDLIVALAVGAVGSIALARRDIADAVPGVAIAISLVPPLAVTGLALESGAGDEAFGAILLFLTNVAAILAVGVVTMGVYHIRGRAGESIREAVDRRGAYWLIGLLLVIVLGLLVRGSWSATTNALHENDIESLATDWAEPFEWEVVGVETRDDGVVVRLEGARPAPDPNAFRDALLDAGIDPGGVELDLVPRQRIDLGAPVPATSIEAAGDGP